MKNYFFIVFTILSFKVNSQNTDTCVVFNNPTAVFYGIDFTLVKFRNVNAYGFNDLNKIRDFHFQEINGLLNTKESLNYLASCFKKEIYDSFSTVNSRNKTTNISTIMTDYRYSISSKRRDSILSFYPFYNENSSLGILILAETLIKVKDRSNDMSFGDYCLVFFNIPDHKVYFSLNISGEAGGMGWGNFWFRSIKKALGEVNMNKLRKKYCPNGPDK